MQALFSQVPFLAFHYNVGKKKIRQPGDVYIVPPEEVGHDFHGKCILLSRIMYCLLTQHSRLTWVAAWVYTAAYGKRTLIRIRDQPPPYVVATTKMALS